VFRFSAVLPANQGRGGSVLYAGDVSVFCRFGAFSGDFWVKNGILSIFFEKKVENVL
jgi:hypothetical protein